MLQTEVSIHMPCSVVVITLHVHARAGGYVIGAGVHIYVYMYICIYVMFVDEKNNLNRTLAIESPFQAFAVGLLVEFIDYLYHCALQICSPRWVNHGFPYLMCTLLYLSVG